MYEKRLAKLLQNLDALHAAGAAGPGLNNIQREINALVAALSPTSRQGVRNSAFRVSPGRARAANQLCSLAGLRHGTERSRMSKLCQQAAGALVNYGRYINEGGPSQPRLLQLKGRKNKYMGRLAREARKNKKRPRPANYEKTGGFSWTESEHGPNSGNNRSNNNMAAPSAGRAAASGVERVRSRTPSKRSNTTRRNSQGAASNASVNRPSPKRTRSAEVNSRKHRPRRTRSAP
jgi:hypothetical protein